MESRRGHSRSAQKGILDITPLVAEERPDVLRACIEGGASLALSSFGASLFYLQRSLIGQCAAEWFSSSHS
jgi:hypothetical protein